MKSKICWAKETRGVPNKIASVEFKNVDLEGTSLKSINSQKELDFSIVNDNKKSREAENTA